MIGGPLTWNSERLSIIVMNKFLENVESIIELK